MPEPAPLGNKGIRLFGLIGFPLSHSFSKQYFDRKFAGENLINCRFENFSIASISDLKKIIKDNPNLEGLAVTIPYKQSVIPYLDNSSKIPDKFQACNCIRIQNEKLIGFNTDHVGFEKSLLPLLKPNHKKALVLGNGGAALAVAFVLEKLKIAYRVVSRRIHEGSNLTYADLDANIISEHNLIINTTPLGMYPDVGAYPDIPYSVVGKNHLLYDLTYNPDKTLFLKKGEERGAAIKNGQEMLELQAEENWKIWNER